MLKCKHCSHTAPDTPELRHHYQSKHKEEWKSFTKSMQLFDQAHAAELSKVCSICPHRGKHAH